MSHILSVTDLTQALKDVLEAEFPFIWVRGQVTNLARPASGHMYFTLSDAGAALPVVWFKNSQGRGNKGAGGGESADRAEKIDPLTGEVLEPGPGVAAALTDGQEVLVAGRVTVYAARGAYQLVAELVQQSGVSDLALAFEALKRKLADQGWFDEARKRPVPANPARVALITSPQGAAVRDFLRLAEARGTGAALRIYPALVQGDAAPAQIAAALDAANADAWPGGGKAEVIALIRGGGSLEDLWAFNTEMVAEAMIRSRVPVVTGVGHEPDVSIADFVADKRFSTPSAVASGLWPLRADLMQAVDGLEAELSRTFGAFMERKLAQLSELRRGLSWLSPVQRLARLEDTWLETSRRLEAAGRRLLGARRERLAGAVRDLTRAFGPAVVEARQERLDSAVRDLTRAFGPAELSERQSRVDALRERATLAVDIALGQAGRQVDVLAARLAGLDPEGPLARGYSLVRIERTGRFLRSTGDVLAGDRLGVRTADGEVAAVVAGMTEGKV
ncbi:MAG: exodeoxyribonuclease VII large subunit [Proteobacteria bacterium]|nr:exodeoxyribonuclease VII large subunit [Pseudomonadota bacterium]